MPTVQLQLLGTFQLIVDGQRETNLHNVLSNLRRLVPNALDILRQSVRWVGSETIRVDLHQFRQAISYHPDQAVPIYQGEFLQGLTQPDAILFEKWRVVRESRCWH